MFEHVKGVTDVVSGYAGGSAADANYDAVSSEGTGHAEAVRITYDPAQISYAQLLQIYFTVAHDPTQVNRQGPDVGPSYRSAIFPQIAAAGARSPRRSSRGSTPRTSTRRRSRRGSRAAASIPAEAYHQDFARKHPYYPVHRGQRPAEGRRAADRNFPRFTRRKRR